VDSVGDRVSSGETIMDLKVIVLVLVGLGAALYIAFRVRKSFKKAGCDSCCESCSKKCNKAIKR